jgi:hypothetical protein
MLYSGDRIRDAQPSSKQGFTSWLNMVKSQGIVTHSSWPLRQHLEGLCNVKTPHSSYFAGQALVLHAKYVGNTIIASQSCKFLQWWHNFAGKGFYLLYRSSRPM